MRRGQANQNFERDLDPSRTSRVRVAAAADRDTSLFWIGSLASLLIVLLTLMLATREAVAEPAAVGVTPVHQLRAVNQLRPVNQQLRAVHQVRPVDLAMPVSRERLDMLMLVPPNTLRSEAEIADETIAAAVERGSNPDLVKPSAFRKRNTDLFRTERPVAIGEQELLLRLRLRAKARRAMSVEVRF